MNKADFKLNGTPTRALTAATLGFFFGAMAISLFGPTARALSTSMGLSPMQVGLLVAAPSLTGSLFRIPFGASVDVNGGCRSFNVLMAASVIGLVGLSVLFSTRFPDRMDGLYGLVLLLGCLAGCGIATFSVGVSQVSYWFRKKDQGFALGVFGGLGTASAGVLALGLPVLLAAFGFVWAYYILTGIMIAGALIYFFLSCNAPYFQLRDAGFSEKESRSRAAGLGQELFPAGNIRDSLRISAGIPQTWLLVGTYFTTFGGFIALTAWFPTYWQQAQGLAPIHAGVLTMVFSVLAAVMRVPGGLVADRLGGVKVSFGALTAAAAACAAMNLDLGWVGLFAVSVVIAVAFGFNNAAVMKLIPVYVQKSVGGASGWVGGLGAFGGFVFPPLLGQFVAMSPEHGFGWGFLLFTALAVVNMLLNYFGMVRRA
ncbi:MFS transporter [Mesosutterella sp. AGMB02718]|uniref:MFS transporter n=1 Tax=Mesosutterella faecium TaxID=2925194 RepID=A0ABT7IP45_9BURK|nr:MFS transporter [Mesosutterella sp. AGMB02718]MDL2059658.1 MFS transporter [Mesosutterella sp. AGMB02718]